MTFGLMFADSSNLFNDEKEFPRPPYSYENLATLAIKNTKWKRLAFDKICHFLAFHFPYFNQNTSWKTFMKNLMVSSKCFVRVSVQEAWEWKMTEKPVEIKLLEASIAANSKWKSKELQSSMRFPHLLTPLESGELALHFRVDNDELELSVEKALEESMVTEIEGQEVDNEDVDDPETVFIKEEVILNEDAVFDLNLHHEPICDENISKINDILGDQATHPDSIPFEYYECKDCGKQYKSEHNLRTHQIKFHDQINAKSFPCEFCGRVFYHNCELKLHLKRSHDNHKPHMCDVCDKYFFKTSDLIKHKHLVHMKTQ